MNHRNQTTLNLGDQKMKVHNEQLINGTKETKEIKKKSFAQFTAIILLLLIMADVIKADVETLCNSCDAQREMQIQKANEISNLDTTATSSNHDVTKLHNKESLEKYPGSIEIRIVGIPDVLPVFMLIAAFLLFLKFIIEI